MTLHTLWLLQCALTTAIGLSLGSFANLAIHRIPQDLSVVSPGSHCPHCSHPIRRRDNIPLISWLLLAGACRDCGAKIHLRYPAVELLVGLLSTLIYLRFIPTPEDLAAVSLIAALFYTVFATALVIATMVDIGHLIIPDSTSILAAPFGILGLWGLSMLGFTDPLIPTPSQALLGAVVAGATFSLFSVVAGFILKHEGLGWGDVKLAVMLGAFLGGWPGLIVVVMIASLLGSVVGILHLVLTRKRAYLPFGPALAVAGIAYLLYGNAIVSGFLPGIAMSLHLV
jgi:leader peptidase (prepilin peptidase)/N-methyltransferase